MAERNDADKDALTGLSGRDGFSKALDRAISQSEQDGTSLSCALLDVDYFARINHENGREAGDAVLKTIVATLGNCLPDGARMFRAGGDEFAALLPGMDKEQGLLCMEKVRSCLDARHDLPLPGGHITVGLTVSVGVASYPDDGQEAREIVHKATEAFYRAKATGHNRVCLARDEKMVTKTSHYTQGQLAKLRELATREGVGDAALLREALDDLFQKYDRMI